MKTYLVTGGAGFIGSNFVHYILNKYGSEIYVINIDKLTYAGNLSNLSGLKGTDNYEFLQADINDTAAISAIFAKYKPDIIINFAAETHVDRSIDNPGIFTYSNILGTQSLLDAALKCSIERFVQISTDEVYGSLDATGFFKENSPLKPSSPYSASKAAADLLANAYYKTYGLPLIISRCSNNYGPRQFPEKLIPLTIKHCLSNIPVPVYGDGMQIRDWIYVKDHCAAIDLITCSAPAGEVYNIGSSCEVENLTIVKTIIDTVYTVLEPGDLRRNWVNYDLIRHVEDRKGHDSRYAIDSSKIKQELNWTPQMNFIEGIKYTVRWYLNNWAG